MSNTSSFSKHQVEQYAAQLSDVVTTPQFMGIVAELASTPAEQRDEKARALLTSETLSARGIPVPEGLRLSTRVFERPEEGALPTGDVEAHGEPDPLGLCASVGGWCVCGSYGQDW